jgi:hypothetical protein
MLKILNGDVLTDRNDPRFSGCGGSVVTDAAEE